MENQLFQVALVIVGIAYKYLLTREKMWGWILSIVSSILTFFYMYLFFRLQIVMSLELCFMSLSLYGIYKHHIKLEILTKIDYLIIFLTIITIIYFTLKQLEAKTTPYEIGASIVFLSGVVLLTQKSPLFKIYAWICFTLGSMFMGTLFIQKGVYILLTLHLLSLIIGGRAICKFLKIYRSKTSQIIV